jgi:competence protein ComEA
MKQLLAALAALLFAHAASAAVNLNTATKDELVALPGIGPAKAQAIVDYRTQHGPFKAVEDVRKVKGIGEKLFLQIRPELSVASSPPKPGPAAAPAKAEPRAEAKGEPKAASRAGQGSIARDDKAKK